LEAILDKCAWVGAGYPVFILAIVALWQAYRGSQKEVRNAELMLLEEKDRRVRELEAFKKIVEDRLHGGRHGSQPF
jgi:hypothetical protein